MTDTHSKTTQISDLFNKAQQSLVLLFLCCTAFSSHANQAAKAAWYRYYDKNGVANISTSVSPAHIRYGYETLDHDMQVIKRITAYNAEMDLRQAPKRAIQAQQQAEDSKLKNAYTNVKVAEQKRNEALLNLKKQINTQQQQLKQLQNDRILFKKQESHFIRKGEPVPAHLKQNLHYNAENIAKLQQSLATLHTHYAQTEEKYNKIISRLKVIS